jgi:hypothetical protein
VSPDGGVGSPTQPLGRAGSLTYLGPGASGGFGGSSRRATVGTIESVNGAAITVRTRTGQTVDVTETNSTSITKMVSISLERVRKGDSIVASGNLAADGTFVAQRITIVANATFVTGSQQGVGRQAGVAAGTVTGVVRGTLTLSAPDGTVATVVTSSPSTAISTAAAASRRDLTAGQTVVVRGSPNADGSITATLIQEGNGIAGFGSGGFGGAGFGRGPSGGGAAPKPVSPTVTS